MAVKMKRLSEAMGKTPKLTTFGKMVVGVLVIVLAVAIGLGMQASARSKAKKEAESNLAAAIERSIVVCRDSLKVLETDNETIAKLETYIEEISAEKKIVKKYDKALEMVGFALTASKGNQGITDELNGTRNRLFVAFKTWNE